MSFSAIESELNVRATDVAVTDQAITVDLADGRSISVPTAWYPRLKHATAKERVHFEIGPFGIEWPDVEADFSVRGLLLGRKSGESGASFAYWLRNRKRGRKVTFEDYLKQLQTHKRRVD